MISTKKIIQMGRKWQKQAMKRRKRIPWPTTTSTPPDKYSRVRGCRAKKGHFVVYSTDERRFVLPLLYLNNKIFTEMLKLAEDEFGLSTNVPLTLPFEATVIEYVVMLIQRNVTNHLHDALLMSFASSRCQSSSHQRPTNPHLLLFGF